METGTLKELNVKPGDVVMLGGWRKKIPMTVGPDMVARSEDNSYTMTVEKSTDPDWFIISRATPTPDLTAITTPFGLLDQATQDALRAHGGPYDWYASNGWQHVVINNFEDHMTYRLQPELYLENVSIDAWFGGSGGVYVTRLHDGIPVRVTFNRINGVIDLASYKVEAR